MQPDLAKTMKPSPYTVRTLAAAVLLALGAGCTATDKAAKGYMGHDEFAVGEGSLLRRFPIYRSGDSNAAPTGGMRQLRYRLLPGEAGWILTPDRVVDY
jgi:hypothetical protein